MKNVRAVVCTVLCCVPLIASGQTDLSADDDLFEDPIVVTDTPRPEADTPDYDSAHGVLFQPGSIKIGGDYDMELSFITAFPSDISVQDDVWNTLCTPKADADFIVDARPENNLRLYAKFGIRYPYEDSVSGQFFSVKELFTDFSVGPDINFRFGKHTVTWGTGYFFSPADIINLTEIDPEHPADQVEGPLSLRTQIVFPGTQNCLWAYIIPDYNVLVVQNGESYVPARDTALALKGEIVAGVWELGLGAWYKNGKAPRLSTTATGSILGKVSVFAEGTVSWGTDSQWTDGDDYSGKSPVWQGTAGLMYYWKDPMITTYIQYYYDGNTDMVTYGNNAAASISFAKIGTTDVTSDVYFILTGGSHCIGSAQLSYAPVKEMRIGAGPYITWSTPCSDLLPSFKMTCRLGGGKF